VAIGAIRSLVESLAEHAERCLGRLLGLKQYALQLLKPLVGIVHDRETNNRASGGTGGGVAVWVSSGGSSLTSPTRSRHAS
jgi:hypothetical protein